LYSFHEFLKEKPLNFKIFLQMKSCDNFTLIMKERMILTCNIFPMEDNFEVDNLQKDVLCMIFSFLEPVDLFLGVATTCKFWNEIIRSGRVFVLHPWIERKKSNSKMYHEGQLLRHEKNFEGSITAFTRALILDPEDAHAFFWRAWVWEELHRYSKALEDLGAALRIDPNFSEALFNKALVHESCGEPDQALEIYCRLSQIDPNDYKVLNNRAMLLESKGRLQEAIEGYSQAVTINPSYDKAYYNRGCLNYNRGLLDDAQLDFKKALEVNPENFFAHNNCGNVLEHKGFFDQALEHYSKSLDINPDYICARNNRCSLYERIGHFSDAMKDASKLLDINPEDPVVLLTHARISWKLARHSIRRVMNKKPKYKQALSLWKIMTHYRSSRTIRA